LKATCSMGGYGLMFVYDITISRAKTAV
jgi:hypothetical protein